MSGQYNFHESEKLLLLLLLLLLSYSSLAGFQRVQVTNQPLINYSAETFKLYSTCQELELSALDYMDQSPDQAVLNFQTVILFMWDNTSCG